VDDRDGPYWRYDLVGRRVLFSAYHLNGETASAYVDVVRRRRLPWLHGYPSFLASLAGFVVEQGLDVGSSVRWVTTGAENLLPAQADVIERAFGVRPLEHYGLAEAVANASLCPSGSLHLDEDFAAMELLPRPGGGFRLVGTAISNPAMPLIRYDTGDVVAAAGTCGCGRPGRVITSIDGRAEDYVVLKDGSLVGRLDHVFKDLVNIREAQIHQREAGAVVVRVVRRPTYSDEDHGRLQRELRSRLGADTTIEIEHVDAIPRSASGKLRLVVSELGRGRLDLGRGG
jgi:phenylacetate-CoA ligase